MVQIVSVSANTAAYVAEAAKQPVRPSSKRFVEETMRPFRSESEEEQELSLNVTANISDATASALNLMTSGHRNPNQQTLQEAIEAYEKF